MTSLKRRFAMSSVVLAAFALAGTTGLCAEDTSSIDYRETENHSNVAQISPVELIEEIESTAKACSSIKDEFQRGYALREIALGFLRLGEYDKALAIADKREYCYWMVYLNAVEPLIRANRSKAAFDIVEKLEAVHWKVDALLRIAQSSADVRRPDDALTALEKVRALLGKGQPQWTRLAKTAELYARVDRANEAAALFSEAWKAYEDERRQESSSESLSQRSLVEIQASAGFGEDAIRRAGQNESWALCQMAIQFATQGKDALADRAASKCDPWHRVHAYVQMAIAQAERGQNDKAEANLKRAEELVPNIKDPSSRRSKAVQVAIARVRIGQPLKVSVSDDMVVHAVDWAQLALLLANTQAGEAKMCLKNALKRIPAAGGRGNQCLAMLKIAEAQLALGVTEDAQATLMRAKKVALAAVADDPEGKGEGNSFFLVSIAMAQKKSAGVVAAKSTFEQAVKTAGDSHVRLREAVENMARAGLYGLAVRTTHGIKLASPRQAAYQAVADAQGQGGQVKEALAWIKRLERVEDRAFALSALSRGFKNRK